MARTTCTMLQSLLSTLTLLSLLTPTSADYTVHSSFLFLRTGDRTPTTLGSTPTTLTPLGASQLHQVGQFFRARYLTNEISRSNTTSANQIASIDELSLNLPVEAQLYLLALDQQFEFASAQAFLQGFYPPFSIMTGGNGGNLGEGDGVVTTLDGLGMLGNGTYVEAPLSGYQYPRIRVASARDYTFIYAGGSLNCPALRASTSTYYDSEAYTSTAAASLSLYQSIGAAFLSDVLPRNAWTYQGAYAIYEYMSYLFAHNTSAYRQLLNPSSGFRTEGADYGDLDRLRWLADTQQTALLANLKTPNPYGRTSLAASKGSISTIAGATLAYKILDQFTKSIDASAAVYKLNALFGDYDAFLSFFALAGLTTHNTNFLGLPAYGSAMAFELFSYSNSSSSSSSSSVSQSASFPPQNELYVRFLFRNGTDSSTWSSGNDSTLQGLQAFPLFGRGPSSTDMPWTEFLDAMKEIAIGGPQDWCQLCGADAVFCALWNTSAAATSLAQNSGGRGGQLRPVVAGLVGAIVAFAVAGLIAAGLAVAGLRVYKVEKRNGSQQAADFAGFRGSSKLASDPDLSIPKSGGFVGAAVERKPSLDKGGVMGTLPGARERVGSWELKESDMGIGRFGPLGHSVESLDVGAQKPVRPDERV